MKQVNFAADVRMDSGILSLTSNITSSGANFHPNSIGIFGLHPAALLSKLSPKIFSKAVINTLWNVQKQICLSLWVENFRLNLRWWSDYHVLCHVLPPRTLGQVGSINCATFISTTSRTTCIQAIHAKTKTDEEGQERGALYREARALSGLCRATSLVT